MLFVVNVFQFTAAVGTKVEIVRKRMMTASNRTFHQFFNHLFACTISIMSMGKNWVHT